MVSPMLPVLSHSASRVRRSRLLVIVIAAAVLAAPARASAWFCANGDPCRPGGALTCCCGDADPGALSCDTDCHRQALGTGESCGCYAARSDATRLVAPPMVLALAPSRQTTPAPAALVCVVQTGSPRVSIRTELPPPSRGPPTE